MAFSDHVPRYLAVQDGTRTILIPNVAPSPALGRTIGIAEWNFGSTGRIIAQSMAADGRPAGASNPCVLVIGPGFTTFVMALKSTRTPGFAN